MSEKIKAIRGSKERAEEVKQWLKEHDALNPDEYSYEVEDFLYYVKPDGHVNFINSEYEYLVDVEKLPLWRAKDGEEYWYIDDAMDVWCTTEDYSRKHDDRYVAHNYFKTQGEAEEYCDKFIKLLEERG